MRLQILCTTCQINPFFAKKEQKLHAMQTPTKLPNTDFHVRDLQVYKSRHLKYLGTLWGR